MTTAQDEMDWAVKFRLAWCVAASKAHNNSRVHGFWEEPGNDGEKIALMHSELSEGLEALRHGNPTSDHIPFYSGIEEELADVVIRILDYSEQRGWDVGGAIVAKMKFNASRPHKHGKGF